MNDLFNEALRRVTEGLDLAEEEAETVFGEIMVGRIEPLRVAALLAALKTKGESAAEIVGAARAMRRAALPFPRVAADAIDTCGTGGDRAGTLNISTGAAIVAAAAGATVAKHGNRAASSRCGSADVLEALGVAIDLGPEPAAACLESAGITFLFAPRYHPAMRHAVEARRALGLRTIFNVLGPLTNPAGVRRQVIGVPDAAAFERVATVLPRLGADHCMVVHGLEGLDEASIAGPTRVAEWKAGKLVERLVRPEDFNLAPRPVAALRGGEARENATRLRSLLSGRGGTDAVSPTKGAGAAGDLEAAADVVALNAGCALYVGGRVSTWRAGVERARETLEAGEGLRKLDEWIRVSHEARAAARGARKDPAGGDQSLHAAP